MFRPMRRHRQQLSQWDCAAILSRGTSGRPGRGRRRRLPLCGPPQLCVSGGTAVLPLCQGRHKLDALRRCSKASFCVIDQDQVVPPEYTTYFRSVIAFGRTRIWRTRRRNKLPFGSWRRNTAPATARSIARRPFAGGRRTVPCVALHRAHDRQAGHRAGSGRPPAG